MKSLFSALKIALDTNVYISAIYFGGKPEEVLNLARAGKIELLISEQIKNEIAQILKRKFSFNDLQISEVLEDIGNFSTLVIPTVILKVIKEDKSDNRILECAVEGGVDYIVSGDSHLLTLKEYQKIKVVSPAEFLDVISERSK